MISGFRFDSFVCLAWSFDMFTPVPKRTSPEETRWP